MTLIWLTLCWFLTIIISVFYIDSISSLTQSLTWFSLMNKLSSWLVHNAHDQMIFDLSWSVTSSQSTLKESALIANDEIMQHDAIFLRLKMTKAKMNEMKIVILAHSKEKMIVQSEEDWKSSSWESEDCWEQRMSSISLCWINDMYKTHFFFCLWAFVFSAHLCCDRALRVSLT